MKRLIIICEGQTEKEFCNSLLYPYFLRQKISVQAPVFKKSGGGVIPWKNLKDYIVKHLHEKEVFVTTFFDFYGIKSKHGFSKWKEAQEITDKATKIQFLEDAMKTSLGNQLSPRFIPYIQLREFEGLLFNEIEAFEQNFESEEFDRQNILEVINRFPNPKMINDNPKTAPSKRLENRILGYNKVVYGVILAESIGLEKIRQKSPRFNHWIEQLEKI